MEYYRRLDLYQCTSILTAGFHFKNHLIRFRTKSKYKLRLNHNNTNNNKNNDLLKIDDKRVLECVINIGFVHATQNVIDRKKVDPLKRIE